MGASSTTPWSATPRLQSRRGTFEIERVYSLASWPPEVPEPSAVAVSSVKGEDSHGWVLRGGQLLRSDWSHPAICRGGGQLFTQAPEPGWRPAAREVAIHLG